MIVGPAAAQPVAFAERVTEERGAVLSLAKVRSVLAGRVAEDELEAKMNELLEGAVKKRAAANQNLVVATDNLDASERARFVRIAHANRRPRHLILLEAPRDDVLDDERGALDELRRTLDGGELGREGFHTARRISPSASAEVKRIVFRPPPVEH
jgi:hypothetical protein